MNVNISIMAKKYSMACQWLINVICNNLNNNVANNQLY